MRPHNHTLPAGARRRVPAAVKVPHALLRAGWDRRAAAMHGPCHDYLRGYRVGLGQFLSRLVLLVREETHRDVPKRALRVLLPVVSFVTGRLCGVRTLW